MASVPLTSVARVKRYLRMDPPQVTGGQGASTVDDALIQDLVDEVTPVIETYCSRTFGLSTYDEIRNGTGTSVVTLTQGPIIDVTTVELLAPRSVPTVPVTTTPLVRLVDYMFTKYSVQLYGGLTFPKGAGNVHVVYQAGFTDLPADVIGKATKVCALRYREIARLGQTSKSMAGETVNFDPAEFPEDVLGVLNRYNNAAITAYARVTVLG